MAMPVTPSDASAPDRASPSFGALRVQALHACLLGRPAQLPNGLVAELGDWCAGITAGTVGDAIGLDPVGLDDDRVDALGWIGVPLARGGALKWGVDLCSAPGQAAPVERDGALWLPDADTLRAMSSLALKPARQFISVRLGCRLQAAAGIHFFQWPNQAVLVSRCAVAIGGFLHGPLPSQRSSISIDPGSFQVLRW
ncbi:MAG: hypothetical protein H0V44_05865 [Planctomycetes bacterium]|nr:hypothetical protein [Planctomycetota bacterium]